MLEKFLLDHNIPYVNHTHKHGRQGWLQVDCPDCGPASQKYHCGIHITSLRCHCWRCGKKDLWQVLRAASPKVSAAGLRSLSANRPVAPPTALQPVGRYKEPAGVGPLQQAHQRYLREQRGYDPDALAATWGIGGIGIAPRLQWRIFIPVHYRGRAVSWQTRAIADEGQRWISASPEEEALPHKELLYGADLAHGACIVHEGCTDCWRTGPGAVGTFGTGYSMAQVAALAQYPVRAICFDNEPAAQARAKVLAAELAVFPGVTHIVELDAPDPGSASAAEVALLRKAFLG